MKYCPTCPVVRNPASIENLLTLSCCDNFSIRSLYLCNRSSSCKGHSVEGVFVFITLGTNNGFHFPSTTSHPVLSGQESHCSHISDCSVKTELMQMCMWACLLERNIHRNEDLLSRLPAILSVVPFRVSQILARDCHGHGALPYIASASSWQSTQCSSPSTSRYVPNCQPKKWKSTKTEANSSQSCHQLSVTYRVCEKICGVLTPRDFAHATTAVPKHHTLASTDIHM